MHTTQNVSEVVLRLSLFEYEPAGVFQSICCHWTHSLQSTPPGFQAPFHSCQLLLSVSMARLKFYPKDRYMSIKCFEVPR